MKNIYEEKNIVKAVITLAIPSMLAQLTTLIYNIADTYFVSMTKDPAQIAAVTLCTPLLLIVMSVSSVFGMGGNSVIARLLGEGRKEEARRVFNFCNYALILSGVITLAIGMAFTVPIADLLGADDINRAFTIDYLRGIFIGAPFIIYANGVSGLFRSVMLMNQSTAGIAIGNGVNIVFDYVFIVTFGMGTLGAALATSLGFTIASAYYFYCIISRIRKGSDILSLSPKDFRPTGKMLGDVVSIGVPGALVTVLMSVANIVLNNYIAIYGSDSVASYGIAYKIDMVPVMLSVGLAQGVAPLIGYAYGANQKERMHRTVVTTAVSGVILGAVFTVLFMLFAAPLSGIFLKDGTLIGQTAHMLKILGISAPALGIINVTSFYYQALGKAVRSLIVTLLRNAVIFIPCVVLLNHLWQLRGVIAAQPVTEGLLMIVCILMYLGESGDRKEAREQNRNSDKLEFCRNRSTIPE